jgi:hypothetical protein
MILQHLLIAGLFYGLYFWARRSPLPALIVSLCLFLVVELGGGARILPAFFSPQWIILISVIWLVGIQQALAETQAAASLRESQSQGD